MHSDKFFSIGSSFIGMEVANAVAKGNDVTVVGMEKAPLERIMGEEVGRIFQKSLEKNGVKFKMSAGVEKAVASESDSSKVGGITLKDGTTLPADLVILGTGVGPGTFPSFKSRMERLSGPLTFILHRLWHFRFSK
jgi:NAD(P)H-nitrite reductase large subunit